MALTGRQGPPPVARHLTNLIVRLTEGVQGEVEANLRVRRGGADAPHLLDDALREQAVGGDGDDGGAALLDGGDDQIVEVRAQERLTAGEGEVEGGVAEVTKHLSPLGQRHVVAGLAPDVAGAAAGVAAKADADHQAEGQHLGPTPTVEQPVQRQLG
jgi:hypothetical protein